MKALPLAQVILFIINIITGTLVPGPSTSDPAFTLAVGSELL